MFASLCTCILHIQGNWQFKQVHQIGRRFLWPQKHRVPMEFMDLLFFFFFKCSKEIKWKWACLVKNLSFFVLIKMKLKYGLADAFEDNPSHWLCRIHVGRQLSVYCKKENEYCFLFCQVYRRIVKRCIQTKSLRTIQYFTLWITKNAQPFS